MLEGFNGCHHLHAMRAVSKLLSIHDAHDVMPNPASLKLSLRATWCFSA